MKIDRKEKVSSWCFNLIKQSVVERIAPWDLEKRKSFANADTLIYSSPYEETIECTSK